jgi:MoaD family protein
MVEILYFAEFKSITNKEKESISLNNDNLMELIQFLIKKYPEMKSLIWDDKKNTINDEISIALNHNIINKETGLSTKLSKDDVIALLMPVSGG